MDRSGKKEIQRLDKRGYTVKNRISQGLKLKNKLILTNKLLISLRVLELNTVDLEEEAMKLAEENPFVEVDFSPLKIRAPKRKASEDSEDAIENTVVHARTLRSYLLEQLYATDVEEKLEKVVLTLIDLLDVHGFLTMQASEVAEEFDFGIEEVETALKILQSFEPRGVGCKDVKESLKAQSDDPVVALLVDHMEEMQKSPRALMESLNISIEKFNQAVKTLKSLNPYPSNGFADSDYTFYVEPDIMILQSGEGYSVFVEEYFEVKLSYSVYEKLVEHGSERERSFAKELFEKASNFVDALNRRKETLVKIGKILAEKEEEFFKGGKKLPLKISEVADEVELSLSTVARAVSTKYVKTPRGVFPLKFFFSRAVYSSNFGRISREEVKEKIRRLIELEDRKKPLTDEQIVSVLRGEGIKLSRRVVAKYREELLIPSSSKRRMR